MSTKDPCAVWTLSLMMPPARATSRATPTTSAATNASAKFDKAAGLREATEEDRRQQGMKTAIAWSQTANVRPCTP